MIQDTKVITFGGCHSEYVHINDLNIFEMENFLKEPAPLNGAVEKTPIICTLVKRDLCPSTRWGHASSVVHNS